MKWEVREKRMVNGQHYGVMYTCMLVLNACNPVMDNIQGKYSPSQYFELC